MLQQLLSLGLQTLTAKAETAASGRRARPPQGRHPLSSYPKLQEIMDRAERSGALAAQRRHLAMRRPIG